MRKPWGVRDVDESMNGGVGWWSVSSETKAGTPDSGKVEQQHNSSSLLLFRPLIPVKEVSSHYETSDDINYDDFLFLLFLLSKMDLGTSQRYNKDALSLHLCYI